MCDKDKKVESLDLGQAGIAGPEGHGHLAAGWSCFPQSSPYPTACLLSGALACAHTHPENAVKRGGSRQLAARMHVVTFDEGGRVWQWQ